MPAVIGAIVSVLSAIGGGSALAGAATLGSLATTGITLGHEIAGSGGGTPPFIDPSITAPKATPSDQQQEQAKITSIVNRFPDIQAQLGGALAPDAFMAMAGNQAGLPGDANLQQIALQNWLGLGDTSGLFAGGGRGGGSGSAPSLTTPSLFTNPFDPNQQQGSSGVSGGST